MLCRNCPAMMQANDDVRCLAQDKMKIGMIENAECNVMGIDEFNRMIARNIRNIEKVYDELNDLYSESKYLHSAMRAQKEEADEQRTSDISADTR
jgi:hypothetical protein